MSSNPSPKASKRTNSMQAITYFKRLQLSVTDNTQVIEKAYTDQQRRIQQLAARPDALDQQTAKDWDEAAAKLRTPKQRELLIQAVYEDFEDLADILLESQINAGQRTLTQTIIDRLKTIAAEQLSCDADLAHHFCELYKTNRNLSDHDPLVKPEPILNLRVNASIGKNEIRWDLPGRGCDAVRIMRSEPGQNDVSLGKTSSTLFTDDKNLKPGTKYTYTLISISVDEELINPPVSVIALGEISGLKCVWEQDHVVLTWTKPSPQCQVYLFRGPSQIAITAGTDTPRPASSGAHEIYHGPASKYVDQDVTPGQIYHYRAVAFFDNKVFSPGAENSIDIPKPPPPVKKAIAQLDGRGVTIRWDTVTHNQPVEYIVRRTEGRRGASLPDQGREIAATRDLMCQDKSAQNGHRYTYTVFTHSQGLYSQSGCVTTPVTLAIPVLDFVAEGTNGVVLLSWKNPPNAKQTIIRRNTQPVVQPNDPKAFNVLVDEQQAQDTNLKNGTTYYYTAWCIYLIDGEEIWSEGDQRTGIPLPEPGTITSFNAELKKGQIVCIWTHTGDGTVQVARTHTEFDVAPDQLFEKKDKIPQNVYWVPPTGQQQASDTKPDSQESIYTPVIISGRYARIGPWTSCVIVLDPQKPRVERAAQGVILRWDWPRNCTSVVIARRQDTPPVGLDDKYAVYTTYSRSEYDNNHSCYLDREAGQGHLFYIVRARVDGVAETIYSTGVQLEVPPGKIGTMRYKLEVVKQGKLRRKPSLVLTWSFDELPSRLSGFVLVANRRTIPDTKDDGIEIFRCEGHDPRCLSYEKQSVVLPLDELHLGNRFYYKLFVIDPADDAQVVILEPYLLDGIRLE